jgi:hypothetical protein
MLVGTNELAPNFLQQGRLRWNSLLVKAALWIGLLLFLRVRKKIAVLSNHDGNGWSLPSWKDGRTLFLFLVGAGMFRELTGQAAYVWLCHVCVYFRLSFLGETSFLYPGRPLHALYMCLRSRFLGVSLRPFPFR